MKLQTRAATAGDIEALVPLVNHAYEVESFFVSGNRVTPDSIQADLDSGTILVVDRDGGGLRACVYVSVENNRGYFGMLAVEPSEQGRGLGRALIKEAEAFAAAAGAPVMTISVVNVRTDLLAFYGRLGYEPSGEAPYVHRPVIQPVHFILMEKSLVSRAS